MRHVPLLCVFKYVYIPFLNANLSLHVPHYAFPHRFPPPAPDLVQGFYLESVNVIMHYWCLLVLGLPLKIPFALKGISPDVVNSFLIISRFGVFVVFADFLTF